VSTPVLELEALKRHFGGIRAVDGVTLAVADGAVVALIGPNGAGKSTLFALMMGELAPSSGTIRLDGHDMKGLSPEQHSRLGVGRTFQTPRLFAGLSVAENAQIALLAHGGKEGRRLGWKDSKRGDLCARASGGQGSLVKRPRARAGHPQTTNTQPLLRPSPQPPGEGHSASVPSPPPPSGIEDVEQMLAEVGLLDERARTASALSQGQRKRLELAMVLALRPRVLLLDEPTAGMGVEERATIMALVMDVVRRRRLTLVFCEHDMETVFAHAPRVVVMDRGKILTDGSPEQIRRDPQVQEIYLGTSEGT
jgi:branched-chain amino acid transport system ATP-binding protein